MVGDPRVATGFCIVRLRLEPRCHLFHLERNLLCFNIVVIGPSRASGLQVGQSGAHRARRARLPRARINHRGPEVLEPLVDREHPGQDARRREKKREQDSDQHELVKIREPPAGARARRVHRVGHGGDRAGRGLHHLLEHLHGVLLRVVFILLLLLLPLLLSDPSFFLLPSLLSNPSFLLLPSNPSFLLLPSNLSEAGLFLPSLPSSPSGLSVPSKPSEPGFVHPR